MINTQLKYAQVNMPNIRTVFKEKTETRSTVNVLTDVS